MSGFGACLWKRTGCVKKVQVVLEKTTSRWFWKRLLAGGFGKDYLQAGSLCTVTSIKLYSFEG